MTLYLNGVKQVETAGLFVGEDWLDRLITDLVADVTDVPAGEVIALIDLYTRTAGDSWTTNTNWLKTNTVGNWQGVTVAGGHVTQIDLNTNNLVGSLTGWNLGAFTSMTHLQMYSNASLSGDFSLTDLPASMTNLVLDSTSSTFTGSLADLSALMVLSLPNTSSVITGALADLPASMTYLSLHDTSSVITGGTGVTATGIHEVYIYTLGLSQAQVDDVALWLYDNRASFTWATPIMQMGGTNAAPSGVYQDGDPPTTGKEYIYEVVNDPEIEGWPTWSVTYTA